MEADDPKKIREIFINIAKDARILSKEEIDKKYEDFSKKYKKLYSIAIQTTDINKDLEKLDVMLSAMQGLDSGSMTKLNADMMVGNKLGKEYIYSKTGGPSSKDYERAVKELNNKQFDPKKIFKN